MMDDSILQTAAAYAEILGATTIFTGVVVGWFQVRFYRSQPRDRVAINLAQTFYNPALARSVNQVQGLPDHASAQDLRSRGPACIEAATIVTTTFETMGLLVYKNIASADIAMELAGGMAVAMYRKLDLWLVAVSAEQDQPTWAEWFEWFAGNSQSFKNSRLPGHQRSKR